MADFTMQMKSFENMTTDKMSKVFRETCFDLGNSIIMGCPVDTGRARMNWQPHINTFIDGTLNAEDKSGMKAVAKVATVSKKIKLGQTFTLSNNLSYIAALEFGLLKGSGAKSINGFSSQAQQGFVRINLMRFDSILKSNVQGL